MSLSLIKTLIQETIINEKRKNQIKTNLNKNKVENLNDTLKKYLNKGYYFHFTDDYSLQGLNVKGEFDTPLGIYAYPLIDEFYYDDHISVPFAGDRKYIFILKLKGDKKLIKGSTYKLKNLKIDGAKLGFTQQQIQSAYENAKIEENPMSALMFLLYASKDIDFEEQDDEQRFTHENSILATKRLRELGYAGMYDNKGDGIIHENEPIQMFFIGSDVCEIIETIENPEQIKLKQEENIKKKFDNEISKMSLEQIIDFIVNNPNNNEFINSALSIHPNILSKIDENKLQTTIEQLQKSKNSSLLSMCSKRIKMFSEKFQIWLIDFVLKNSLDGTFNVEDNVYLYFFTKVFKNNDFRADVVTSKLYPINGLFKHKFAVDLFSNYLQTSKKYNEIINCLTFLKREITENEQNIFKKSILLNMNFDEQQKKEILWSFK